MYIILHSCLLSEVSKTEGRKERMGLHENTDNGRVRP